MLDNATATSLSSSTRQFRHRRDSSFSSSSLQIQAKDPLVLASCCCSSNPPFCACFLASVRPVESGYSIKFDSRGCLLPSVGLCVLVIPIWVLLL
ncbi:hypothetical protein AHAS_Ahas19G0111000 [Arachis hypogaea]